MRLSRRRAPKSGPSARESNGALSLQPYAPYTNIIMLVSTTFLITSLSLSTLSAEALVRNPPKTHCPAKKTVPHLPANQAALSIPAGETTSFVALGRGVQVSSCELESGSDSDLETETDLTEPGPTGTLLDPQNYTCATAGGNWTSVGAVAQLFDVSCLTSSHHFDSLPTSALKIAFEPRDSPSAACGKIQIGKRAILGHKKHHHRSPTNDLTKALLLDEIRIFCPAAPSLSFAYLGFHSFVTFNATLSPKFDFSASQKKKNAYVIAAKVGSVPSPQDPKKDVAWLELAAKDPKGTLAKTVFRTYTAGGQPPVGTVSYIF